MEVYNRSTRKPKGSYTEHTPIAARAWEMARPCLVSRGLGRAKLEGAYRQVCRMASDACTPEQTFTDVMEALCRQIRDGSPLTSLKTTRSH